MRRLGIAMVALVACARPSPKLDVPPDATPTIPDAAPPPTRTLTGFPWQIDLVSGKEKLGAVSVPLGAHEPRPILIALHGGGDRPGWACGEWRGIVNAYPFVVCPRGQGASDAGLAWSSAAKTKEAIDRALAATVDLFGDWILDAPMVLAGFSMGATQAMLLAREDPKKYARVAICENAYDPSAVSAFASAYGGGRVIFSCTTNGCEPVYKRAGQVLGRRVPTRVNIAGTNQHGIWETVVRSMRRDWPWLVAGERGWETYVPPDDAELPGATFAFDPP